MSTNDITSLRGHLFDTLRALNDKESPMDVDRARAVSDIAQTIINSAKVELEHLKVTGARGTGFLPEPDFPTTLTPHGTKTVTAVPGATVTHHRLRR